MQVTILGAHNTEAGGGKPASILIDGRLALDAGGLCHALSLDDQRRVEAVLLTHYHYDHIRDIPLLAMNVARHSSIDLISSSDVLQMVAWRLLDGTLYPKFTEWPEDRPAVRLVDVEPYRERHFAGYRITPVPVSHSVQALGYLVRPAGDGGAVFYTGDAGPGLSSSWAHVSPDLLITEMTMPEKMVDWAREVSHLTPMLLKAELASFLSMKGYLPRIVLMHINPAYEEEIAVEVEAVARQLGADIIIASEGAGFQV